jgi:hypothetical protein
VLVFEFRGTTQGAIHAIGLKTDNEGDQPLYALYGSQNVTGDPGGYRFNHTYETYTDGDGWVRYEIPVGGAFQGDVSECVFVNDLDGGDTDPDPDGIVFEFRNVRVEER